MSGQVCISRFAIAKEERLSWRTGMIARHAAGGSCDRVPGWHAPGAIRLKGHRSMLSFFLLHTHLGNDLGFVHAVVDAVLDSRSRKPGSAQGVLAMIPLGSMRLTTIIHCASLWISFHHGWPLWVWTGWLPGMSPLFKVGVLKKSPQSSCIFPNLLAPWNPVLKHLSM